MQNQDNRYQPILQGERISNRSLQARDRIDDDDIEFLRAQIEVLYDTEEDEQINPPVDKALIKRSSSFISRIIDYPTVFKHYNNVEQLKERDKYFNPDLNFLYKVLSNLEFYCLPPKPGTTSMHPLLPRIYFGTIAILMIARAEMKGNGRYYQMPRDDIVSEFFLKSGFIHSINIPLPLVPIFKALNCQRLKDHIDQRLIPALSNPETLPTREVMMNTFQLRSDKESWMGIPDIHELYMLYSRFNSYTTKLPPELTYTQFRSEEVTWKTSTLSIGDEKKSPLKEFHTTYDLHDRLSGSLKFVFCRAGFNYPIRGSPDRNRPLQDWKDLVCFSRSLKLNPTSLRNFLHLESFEWFQKLINEMNNHYSRICKTKTLASCLDFKSFSNSVVYYKLEPIDENTIIPELFSHLNDPIKRVYEDNVSNVSNDSLFLARQSFLNVRSFYIEDEWHRPKSKFRLYNKKSPKTIEDCTDHSKIIETTTKANLAIEHQVTSTLFK